MSYQHNLKPIIPEITKYCDYFFRGIKCGIAQYEEGPTGCTVIIFENDNGEPMNVSFYADRRGGAIGAVFDDFGIANGFCFSGGSLYGLEAVFGVMEYFHEKSGFSNDWMKIPDIPGAIIFDFGPRQNAIYPDKKLGYFAASHAKIGRIPTGQYGAGRLATVGKGFDFTLGQLSGQGASFKEIGDVKILAISVVNAIGAIMDRTGQAVLGHFDRQSGQRIDLLDMLQHEVSTQTVQDEKTKTENTTLTLVITNHKFGSYHLKQIARQLHSSMSKMIYPFHTSNDGDILFFASTNEIEPIFDDVRFSMLASEVVWDAVLSIVD